MLVLPSFLSVMVPTRVLIPAHSGGILMARLSFALGATSALALLAALPAAAETRSFAVSSFTLAAANQNGDCSLGINLPRGDQEDVNLLAAGFSKEQVEIWKKEENYGAAARNAAANARGADGAGRAGKEISHR